MAVIVWPRAAVSFEPGEFAAFDFQASALVQALRNPGSHGRYVAWLTLMCQRSSLRVRPSMTKRPQQMQTGRTKGATTAG